MPIPPAAPIASAFPSLPAFMPPPAIHPILSQRPPVAPSPAQLAGWLADGQSVLQLAAQPARLWGVLSRGHSTPAQRRKVLGRIMAVTGTKLVSVSRWLAEHAASGKATLSGWFSDFAGVMAPGLYAAAMAILGTVSPAPADVKAADDQVARQYAFLTRFRDQVGDGSQPIWAAGAGAVAAGPPLALGGPLAASMVARDPSDQFLNRSTMYADAAWSVAEAVVRAKAIRDGFPMERRLLGAAEKHCSACINIAGMGWQPAGSLPILGSSPCRINCRCVWSFGHIDSATGLVIAVGQP